jgi:hypothetical protein
MDLHIFKLAHINLRLYIVFLTLDQAAP